MRFAKSEHESTRKFYQFESKEQPNTGPLSGALRELWRMCIGVTICLLGFGSFCVPYLIVSHYFSENYGIAVGIVIAAMIVGNVATEA